MGLGLESRRLAGGCGSTPVECGRGRRISNAPAEIPVSMRRPALALAAATSGRPQRLAQARGQAAADRHALPGLWLSPNGDHGMTIRSVPRAKGSFLLVEVACERAPAIARHRAMRTV